MKSASKPRRISQVEKQTFVSNNAKRKPSGGDAPTAIQKPPVGADAGGQPVWISCDEEPRWRNSKYIPWASKPYKSKDESVFLSEATPLMFDDVLKAANFKLFPGECRRVRIRIEVVE